MARKYGVSVATIQQANDLSKGKRLYAGQVLTVPLQYGKKTKPDATSVISNAPPVSKVNDVMPERSQTVVKQNPNRYMVKNGDTLWEIAAAYGVSISDLKRLNNISANTVYAGRWLKIPERSSDSRVQTAQITYDIYTVRRGDNLVQDRQPLWGWARGYQGDPISFNRISSMLVCLLRFR